MAQKRQKDGPRNRSHLDRVAHRNRNIEISSFGHSTTTRVPKRAYFDIPIFFLYIRVRQNYSWLLCLFSLSSIYNSTVATNVASRVCSVKYVRLLPLDCGEMGN